MLDPLKRRWKPHWSGMGDERFIGHAGELDVYYEYRELDPTDLSYTQVYLVGPDSRIKGNRGYNFDGYDIVDGSRIVPDESALDVHVELSEMCEVYRLAAGAGLIVLEADDGA